MKVAEYENGYLKIKFTEYYHFQNELAFVKSIKDRVYIKPYWVIPCNKNNVKILQDHSYNIINNPFVKKSEYVFNDFVLDENKTLKNLFPFQKDGLRFLLKSNGRCLLADEQGLGKTIQSISYIVYNNEFPVLIICPASLKYNWENEIRKNTEIKSIQVIEGSKDKIYKNDVYIINYDIISNYSFPKLKLIIVDEAHYTANDKSIRSKNVKRITKGVNKIIALTGTPIENYPINIYQILNIINPEKFNNKWEFAKKFCDLKLIRNQWSMRGATNIEELFSILNNGIMLRRKKVDVLPELPEKLVSVIPVKIDMTEYNKILEELENADYTNFLVKVEKLKQIIWEEKKKYFFDFVNNLIEKNNKVVCFGIHRKAIEEISEKYEKSSVKIDGSVSNKKRQKAIEKFQNDKDTNVFVGNIRAASVGITLTSSDSLVMFEIGWKPSELLQAEDRIHRIGQDQKCNIYYLIAQGTIEVDLIEFIDTKRKIADQIIDGKTDEESFLKNLYKKFKNMLTNNKKLDTL